MDVETFFLKGRSKHLNSLALAGGHDGVGLGGFKQENHNPHQRLKSWLDSSPHAHHPVSVLVIDAGVGAVLGKHLQLGGEVLLHRLVALRDVGEDYLVLLLVVDVDVEGVGPVQPLAGVQRRDRQGGQKGCH